MMNERHARAALELAISKSGGASNLAKTIGVSKGAISKWRVVPIARVLDVEQASGVSRYDLRPDYYPR